MDLGQNQRAYEAKDADVEAYREKLEQVMVVIVNYRGGIVVDGPSHLHKKQQEPEGNGQLLAVEPDAHDDLLDDGHRVTDAKNEPAQQQVVIIVLLKPQHEHNLADQAADHDENAGVLDARPLQEVGENEGKDDASNGSDREHEVELGVVNLHVLLYLKLEGRLRIAAERAEKSKKRLKEQLSM